MKIIRGLLIGLSLGVAIPCHGQGLARPLYPAGGSGSEDWKLPEYVQTDGSRITIHNVAEPEISAYLPGEGTSNGAAIVILPGGSLRLLSVGDTVQEQIREFNAAGIAVFLLKYRVLQIDPDAIPSRRAPLSSPPRNGGDAPQPSGLPTFEIVNGNANPAKGDEALDEVLRLAVKDGQAALQFIRSQAGQWGIDPGRVGMIGTSAGGGVAFGTLMAQDPGAMPDFIVSNFGPALQDITVPADAPPLFLAVDADHGPVTAGVVALYDMWRSAGEHAELHVYDVRTSAMRFSLWGKRLLEWMQERGLLGDENTE